MTEATLTRAACQRVIRERNETLKAVLTLVDPPRTDPNAAPDAPLSGLPFVLKDTWDTEGIRTTGGSYRHRARVPATSAAAYRALLRAGAVLLGKSNVCDLAFSAETDNHLIGRAQNPHDPSRTPGGSTGGGAAAVASGMAAFDWGTDFAGSIRIPAAFCGIVGLRLSAGAWPVERDHFPRVTPRFWPFLGMGPLARDVATCRRVVDAVRSLRRDVTPPEIDPERVVVYPPDWLTRRAWPTFESDARAALTRLGVEARDEPSLPTPTTATRAFDGYLSAHFIEFVGKEELSLRDGIVAALLGIASGGRLEKRLQPKGALLFALAAFGRVTLFRDKDRATDVLEETRAAFRRVWEDGMLIVSPTTTVPAPRHGRTAFDLRLLSFAKAGNVADATALALPFGRFADGLPRSLRILGPPGSEEAVLSLAERIESCASPTGESVASRGADPAR